MQINIFSKPEEAAVEFANYLEKAIAASEAFHLALSGGSTPRTVFEVLATSYIDRINWSKVHIYWGDERCVPPDDAESNYKMAWDTFLFKVGIPESQIHRIAGENTPEKEALRYGELLQNMAPMQNEAPRLDLIILGMGTDGHTASIFPHQIDLWDAPQMCVVATHPDSGQQRVSFTGKVINNAKAVVFLVTGSGKAEKVSEIIKRDPRAESYPAMKVEPQNGKLIWWLDQEAAAKL